MATVPGVLFIPAWKRSQDSLRAVGATSRQELDILEQFLQLARARFIDWPDVVAGILEQHLQGTAHYRIPARRPL